MSSSTVSHNTRYILSSVETVAPPEGMPDGDWVQYIVEYGEKKMNCIRAGTLKEVTLHAEEYVEYLNIRTSKGYSTYSPRKVIKPPQ